MTVLFIILGILMVIGGFSCMFTPLITFLSLGNFIVIMVLVYGIVGIVRAIKTKNFGIGFVFSILSVVFGIAVFFLPNLVLISDTVILYMTAAWFVLLGILQITMAVSVTKKMGSGSRFGLMKYAVGLETLSDFLKLDEWNEDHIFERAEWLYQKAVDIWKIGSGLWILQLILGILGILIGIYSFFQPALMALTTGVMVGLFFVETGFTMILGGIAIRD